LSIFKCRFCGKHRDSRLRLGNLRVCKPCGVIAYNELTNPGMAPETRVLLAHRQQVETSRRSESELRLRSAYSAYRGETRICSSCNIAQPISLFNKRSKKSEVLSSRCRVCTAASVARVRFRQAGRPRPDSFYSRVVTRRLLEAARHAEGQEARLHSLALVDFEGVDLAVFPEVTFYGAWRTQGPVEV
jgi:hypothetical protein